MRMFVIRTVALVSMLGYLLCCSPPVQDIFTRADKGQAVYTAHNIWFENPGKIFAINYKRGNIIPAGMQVDHISSGKGRLPHIDFRVVEWDQEFRMFIDPRFHPRAKTDQIMARTFSTDPPDALFSGKSSTEVQAIKEAIIVPGMSREAVLMSFGYPPSHVTIDLDLPNWIYWGNRWTQLQVQFDKQGKTTNSVDWR